MLSVSCLQVSVPQSELLSLISAAKSLGIRGLAEDSLGGEPGEAREEAGERGGRRGLKREQDPGEAGETGDAKRTRGPAYPKLQHKLANKSWSQPDPLLRYVRDHPVMTSRSWDRAHIAIISVVPMSPGQFWCGPSPRSSQRSDLTMTTSSGRRRPGARAGSAGRRRGRG